MFYHCLVLAQPLCYTCPTGYLLFLRCLLYPLDLR
jgi:hypothetical protein